MVKRQTVWLSTMMVLSLMLIGYYTVNNGAGSGTSTTGGTASITTSTTPNAGNTTGSSSNGSTGSGSTATSQTSTTNVDWFAESKTTQQQDFAKEDQTYKTIISSDKSTNAEVVQAQQADKQLNAIQGAIGQAQDAVKAEGFKDCVIFPTTDTKTGNVTKVSVYVQTSKLSQDQAIKVMNAVSQTMGISINSIVVHEHK